MPDPDERTYIAISRLTSRALLFPSIASAQRFIKYTRRSPAERLCQNPYQSISAKILEILQKAVVIELSHKLGKQNLHGVHPNLLICTARFCVRQSLQSGCLIGAANRTKQSSNVPEKAYTYDCRVSRRSNKEYSWISMSPFRSRSISGTKYCPVAQVFVMKSRTGYAQRRS